MSRPGGCVRPERPGEPDQEHHEGRLGDPLDTSSSRATATQLSSAASPSADREDQRWVATRQASAAGPRRTATRSRVGWSHRLGPVPARARIRVRLEQCQRSISSTPSPRDDTAAKLGTGDLDVLATPRLITWCENAAFQVCQKSVDENHTTVGTMIKFEHVKGSPVGTEVTIHCAEPINDGRRLVALRTVKDTEGEELGGGEVDRAIVNPDRLRTEPLQEARESTTHAYRASAPGGPAALPPQVSFQATLAVARRPSHSRLVLGGLLVAVHVPSRGDAAPTPNRPTGTPARRNRLR